MLDLVCSPDLLETWAASGCTPSKLKAIAKIKAKIDELTLAK
jgi:hypothetical protein